MPVTKIDRATPEVEVRTSDSRHRTDIGWLHGRHSFDTGIDPCGSDTHHGLLVVNNHDIIEPGTGFDTHPHRNLEIVTWVMGGSLVHQDSEGHSGVIYRDLAQRMSAGRGIWHSERNDRSGTDEPVELVQMWVVPDETETIPGYEQLKLSPSDLDGKLAVIASGMLEHGDETAIRIRNRRAAFHVARLDAGQSVEVPEAPFVHLYFPRGEVVLEDVGTLHAGDAVRLTGAEQRRVGALVPSEVLVWEMHASLASRR